MARATPTEHVRGDGRDWLWPPPPPKLSEIIGEVARYTRTPYEAITGHCRRSRYVSARHLAMWFCRHLRPDLSLPQIARAFGCRDHTSVMYGVRRAEERLGGKLAGEVWREICG